MGRNLYLKTISVEEALDKYIKRLEGNLKYEYETIPVLESLHRITGEAVYAKYCSPLFNAAAMDGIAVISKNTVAATELTPLIIEQDKDYKIVDTGDPINAPYDAVIMAEDVVEVSPQYIKIFKPAVPWQHIRPIGEDIVSGEIIITSLQKIRPIDISVLLSAGITEIKVIKKPSVAILPTGTEIIDPTDTPIQGSIIESNSRMFENLIIENGAEPKRLEVVPDDYELIKKFVREATQSHDMVIVNAGSSAGTEDYTVHVLRELGEVIVHGVAMKPGKPVILAIVNGKPVIGLPGYPVSAYLAFEKFVVPALQLLTYEPSYKHPIISAVLSRRLVSSLKHTEYIRVKVGEVNGQFIATPLSRGAGAAMSLVRADGFCIIPQEKEGYEAGERVEIELTRPKEEIEHTIVIIGSHDLILDVMSDVMSLEGHCYNISSTHVGSMGGLMALKRNEALLAPTHLLDEVTGEYNLSYIKEIFDEPMALIKGIKRIQGIIVKKGNPLQIHTIEDLKRVRYVNRQRGAGTRVLFDYLLKQSHISSDQIEGYNREATTHMAVAAAVQSDSADAGMGVLSAANALDLDFIPIGEEEYDFTLKSKNLESPMVKEFIRILTSNELQDRIMKMGGYDCSRSGEIIKGV